MNYGFIKVAAGTPELRVADCEFNKNAILKLIAEAKNKGVQVLCLPELCLCGSTCGDLFLQKTLLDGVEKALADILVETAEYSMLFALGVPARFEGKLYNCAAVCCKGKLLALVPKTFVPNYGEHSQGRWFTAPNGNINELSFARQETFFSGKAVFTCQTMEGVSIGVEISEDLWAVCPPSSDLALAGATIILNLAACAETIASAEYRRDLVKTQSARACCGYVFAAAGQGESTTDLVFAGHDIIAENGVILGESRFENGLTISELDINHLEFQRRRITTFPERTKQFVARADFELEKVETVLTRRLEKSPFVPSDLSERAERCREILEITALGLKKRMEHTGAKKLVLGLSGGLDSTLALLICAKAMDKLALPRENILAITMPGFGTSDRTRGNAEKLSRELQCSLKTVSIAAAVRQHFSDIGHAESDHSVVYENAQARERTQVLMDIANQGGALVVGTGDMSELALGWATYNGDHMSMYGVNSGIPKTLVWHLVDYCAKAAEAAELQEVLRDVLATPVSPELLPPENGDISQKTEELVGPYELHDFFMYSLIRWGDGPKKVLHMAELAFAGEYDRATILKWLRVFITRFFSQQFKRSCLPDGPKVGSLSLSPRGDFKMPSDAVCDLWLQELPKN